MPATVYNETRIFDANKENLFTNCTLALAKCGFCINDIQTEKGLILAKAGLTLWSFGEDLSVSVDSSSGKVTMKSNCTVWARWNSTQFYQDSDWGKNQSNIQKFFSKLENIIKQKNHLNNNQADSYKNRQTYTTLAS